jgi:hypothetical protein
MRVKIALGTDAGELDSKSFEVPDDYQESEPGIVTDAMIRWLSDEAHILDVGDTISITEIE